MKLKNQIKFYRKINNMTQKELANILNVSDKTISSWENGRTYPDIKIVEKMSDVFGLSLDDFLKKEIVDNVSNKQSYPKTLVYKGIVIYINIIFIIVGFFEITEIFQFHFPLVTPLILICIIFNIKVMRVFKNVSINKNNAMFFLFIFILNLLLSFVGSDLLNIIYNQNVLYIKGLILGRIVLSLIYTLLIFCEIKIWRMK